MVGRRAAAGWSCCPTGTGKTHLANLAIETAGRPTLVITPTIDLMNQWYDELTLSFGVEVGLLGGGYYDIQPADRDDLRLGLHEHGTAGQPVRTDRLRRVPPPARPDLWPGGFGAIAPFRLGLTATPERADNAHTHLDQLIGPIVFRREITQLRGRFLAEYRVDDASRSAERRGARRGTSRRARSTAASSRGGHRHAQARRLEPVPLHGAPVARGPRRRSWPIASSARWPWPRRPSSTCWPGCSSGTTATGC